VSRARARLVDAVRAYGVAVAAVAVTLPLAIFLWPLTMPTISPVFLAAVMVSAWIGGLRGGLLATGLATLVMDYFFLKPIRSIFWFSHHDDLIRLGVFVLVAILISALNAARRRAEAILEESRGFLRSTLDALTARIAIIDSGGRIIAVNAAWRRAHETTGEPCEVGSDYLALHESASGEVSDATRTVAAGIRDVLDRRRDQFSAELPEGRRWFAVLATRFTGPGSIRVVVAHEDVTERRRAEEAERAAEGLRSVARLANAAAHEINNPLATILGNLQLLGRELNEDMAKSRIQPALDAVERIREIVARMGHITELRVVKSRPLLPEMLDLRGSSSGAAEPRSLEDASPAPPSE